MTRLVIVVSKVCSLCSKRTKGEKRKEEEIAAGRLNAINPELKALQAQFQVYMDEY